MKKIRPSTPCSVVVKLQRESGGIVRESHDNTKFGYLRDGINLALAIHQSDTDPVSSIEVLIAIGGDK